MQVFLCFCVSVFLCFCVSVFLCFCVSVFLCFCVSVFSQRRSTEVTSPLTAAAVKNHGLQEMYVHSSSTRRRPHHQNIWNLLVFQSGRLHLHRVRLLLFFILRSLCSSSFTSRVRNLVNTSTRSLGRFHTLSCCLLTWTHSGQGQFHGSGLTHNRGRQHRFCHVWFCVHLYADSSPLSPAASVLLTCVTPPPPPQLLVLPGSRVQQFIFTGIRFLEISARDNIMLEIYRY